MIVNLTAIGIGDPGESGTLRIFFRVMSDIMVKDRVTCFISRNIFGRTHFIHGEGVFSLVSLEGTVLVGMVKA